LCAAGTTCYMCRNGHSWSWRRFGVYCDWLVSFANNVNFSEFVFLGLMCNRLCFSMLVILF
jgi:hypothetical protein